MAAKFAEINCAEDELQLKVIEAGKQSEYAVPGRKLSQHGAETETRSNNAVTFLSLAHYHVSIQNENY
ncbi:hypothetical protein Tco_0863445 [Tanacetum coccineum]